jgi:hypothetical protein
LPLVKSPTMTPRKMAANRANATKSTGPRTPEGQRRVMLNGLRHGADSAAFRANLMKAGQNVELFDWIHKRVREEMPLAKPRVAEHLARRVWCGVSLDRSTSQGPKDPPPTQASLWCAAWTPWRAGGLATKPRYTMTSIDPRITYLPPGSRIRIADPSSQRRLMFWVRRRRGTRVRLPVTAWPEIAAWVMSLTPQLHTGEQKRNRLARVGLKASGTLRPLKE